MINTNLRIIVLLSMFLSACGEKHLSDISVCSLIENPEKYAGKHFNVLADTSFNGHRPTLTGAECHDVCAYWKETKHYKNYKDDVQNASPLSGAIIAQNGRNRAPWADAKIYMEGYIKPGKWEASGDYANRPEFYVVKVHHFKMLSRAESFDVVCGHDLNFKK